MIRGRPETQVEAERLAQELNDFRGTGFSTLRKCYDQRLADLLQSAMKVAVAETTTDRDRNICAGKVSAYKRAMLVFEEIDRMSQQRERDQHD